MTCVFCGDRRQPAWLSCSCPGSADARSLGYGKAYAKHVAPRTLKAGAAASTPTHNLQPNEPRDGWQNPSDDWQRGLNFGRQTLIDIITKTLDGLSDGDGAIPDPKLDPLLARLRQIAQNDQKTPAQPKLNAQHIILTAESLNTLLNGGIVNLHGYHLQIDQKTRDTSVNPGPALATALAEAKALQPVPPMQGLIAPENQCRWCDRRRKWDAENAAAIEAKRAAARQKKRRSATKAERSSART